ncbi:sulfotransferase family 2 domain-containing protein [Brevundimonas sp.]|uniref:sulfotransferase family 2 domain-containing protein n=1 Tax=Brevundimonas sp. TaxID=1871086 RepID=UPI0025FBE5D7|nr:sulfotransferase family 2 domain-containing protein [Brevundimonas sp.]
MRRGLTGTARPAPNGGMGVLSTENRFVFIHVPKTAGQSLSRVLATRGKRFGACKALLESAGDRDGIQHPEHIRAREVAAFLGPKWDRFYTFAIVRNPWDRMVSLYHFIRQTPSHPQHALTCAQTFSEFVDHPDRILKRPQSDWLEGEDGRLLVSEVVRYEELNEAYPRFMARCGFDTPPELPVTNASERGSYRSYFDRELAHRVGELYAEDVERFGYSF